MPQDIKAYRIFIGSPGGLEKERKAFRGAVEIFNRDHALHDGVMFQPVAWEDTLPGSGRPQAIINEDLKSCDYAIFVFHDRWGSASATDGDKVGTQEEWEIAEDLHAKAKILDIALFFKNILPAQARDPGEQLQKVLKFKQEIIAGRKYLSREFADKTNFRDVVDSLLAKWKRDVTRIPAELQKPELSPPAQTATGSAIAVSATDAQFWIDKGWLALEVGTENFNPAEALIWAREAFEAASGDLQWADAAMLQSVAHYYAKEYAPALDMQDQIIDRFGAATEPALRENVAKALVNKGVALGALGRHADAIKVYDDVDLRFGAATEPALREVVAKALVNKGVALGQLGRDPDEIRVYDDVVLRFGAATELALREVVAGALCNKGVAFCELDRHADAIKVCDDVVLRFGAATEPVLREQVAKALVNKGAALGQLGRNADAIKVCDDVVLRFGAATEPVLREQVAKALVNKGAALAALGHDIDAIKVFDDVVLRFKAATEPGIRDAVERARRGLLLVKKP